MPDRTPALDTHVSPFEEANKQMLEGQPEEMKPVTAIPWFFIVGGVVAIVLMVFFLATNR